jgi:hypothetical protein
MEASAPTGASSFLEVAFPAVNVTPRPNNSADAGRTGQIHPKSDRVFLASGSANAFVLLT